MFITQNLDNNFKRGYDQQTLRAVAGLPVAALHRGGAGLRATLVHGVEVPLLVGADHLALPGAGAAALGTLRRRKDGPSAASRTPPETDVPSELTSPHGPTCQRICLGQAGISHVCTAGGRSKARQEESCRVKPSDPTQVTVLVCSPEPQLTEHCNHAQASSELTDGFDVTS